MSKALQLTQKMLNAVEKPKDIMDIQAVADNWIATYEKVSGKKDGKLRFEAEKILFLQTVGGNKALDNCNKFTLYSAFIELAISGLSLRDGLSYIIPFKDKATFMVGWKGRLEQINELPQVVFTHEPQVVFDCDDFQVEKGMKTRIIKHIPCERTKEAKITHVYFVIDFSWGPEAYIMDATEVLAIRDNYSTSYRDYMKKKNTGKWEDWMDVPMWVSDEIQAFKKTIVKRAYNQLPKLNKHKYLDSNIHAAGVSEFNDLEEREEFDFAGFSKIDDVTGEVYDEATAEILPKEDDDSTF